MRRVFLGVLMCSAMAAGISNAQGIGRIVGNTGLTPQDLTIMGDNARDLYDVPSPQVGRSIDWRNEESKSHGTTTLAAMTDGCASIHQLSFPKGQAQPFEYRTRWCRDASGQWVLQP